MMDDRDPALQALFASPQEDLAGEVFTMRVMSQTDNLKSRATIRRVFIGLALGLLAIPLQELAVPLTQLMVVSLFDLDNLVLAQVLAPLNTVGSALSMVLLGMRVVYKRIFS